MSVSRNNPFFEFGTKAQTLERLRPFLRQAQIVDLYYFEDRQWCQSKDKVLKDIEDKFGHIELAVRSSALEEDQAERSMAGAFTSCLNVDGASRRSIASAIETVIARYRGNPHHQVLVQPMLKDIAVSGVITTRVLNDGGPYYVINYDDESGKTDTITGGTGVNKTVLIHRAASPSLIESERLLRWFRMSQEIESVCGNIPLDIEFAQNHSGELFVLQVRKITIEKHWNPDISQKICEAQSYIERFIAERSRPRWGLAGDRTILGVMPDWNPAEMIGTSPRPLAVSLYRRLLTDDIWRVARARMGYRHPSHEILMVVLGGCPYIDVRNSFNSFLPVTLNDKISGVIVNAWLERLDRHPELHDKVEFEIAQTILDFNFDHTFQERYADTLNREQLRCFKEHLRSLTKSCVDLSDRGTLKQALNDVSGLSHLQSERAKGEVEYEAGIDYLARITELLDECRRLGTLPFAVIARHAFIAESLLRSAVKRGALTTDRVAEFKRTIVTVMGVMFREFRKVCCGTMQKAAFLKKYGHLRPGTYDILSLRYDQRDDLFAVSSLPDYNEGSERFTLTIDEHENLRDLLEEVGLRDVSPNYLLDYCETAIMGREHAKFVFSNNVSDSLEVIAKWGERSGLCRNDLSYLSLDAMLSGMNKPVLENNEHYYRRVAREGRQMSEVTTSLRLGYVIRDRRDIYVIPLHRSAPNFVTNKRIEGHPVFISNRMTYCPDLFDMIVCIENADPGFDWIFTRGIVGLITKFGGSNSHMAIRCAELGLPAAIGCGEQTFERLIGAGRVVLNCAEKSVRPVYG